MIVSAEVVKAPFYALSLSFTPESESDLEARAGQVSFEGLRGTPVVTELLPQSGIASVEDIHPDLVALAALLVCGQTRTRSLTLPVNPSEAMTQVAREKFHVSMTGAGSAADRRAPGLHPGLAFSGGVDSCAALLAMPYSTASFFMKRFSLNGKLGGLYNDSAAVASTEALQRAGLRAAILRCNVETIRTPVGFPVDWSNALPLVVNADAADLGSISFGTILESASGLGKDKYSRLSERSIYSRWAPAFGAAGVEMSLPVAGLSEVLTSRIVLEEGGFMQAQSCVRGVPGSPCKHCFKCFRKSLTEWALGGSSVEADVLIQAVSTKEVNGRLRKVPIHHEIGLAWAASKVDSDLAILQALRRRADAISDALGGLQFLERPYWKNVDELVPPPLVDFVSTRLVSLFGKSVSRNDASVEAWNVDSFVGSAKYLEGVALTNAALDR